MTLRSADENAFYLSRLMNLFIFTYLKDLGLRVLGLISHVTIPSGMAT